MNTKYLRYLTSLLCITLLALAPACCKRQEKATTKEDVNTMIEVDNSVFEIEEDNDTKKGIVKF